MHTTASSKIGDGGMSVVGKARDEEIRLVEHLDPDAEESP
jgi:hypothetical protein